MKMRQEVRALGQKWVWKEELRYAGIEAPSKVKERLVKEDCKSGKCLQ